MLLRGLFVALSSLAASSAQAQWQQLPGRAADIGIGARDAAWAIGVESVEGGHPIFRWTGRDWERVPGGAVRLDVDPQGRPWVINAAGEILRLDGTGWRRLPGLARDIGIGASGAVWAIGVNAAPGGYAIYRWTGSDWDLVSGGGVRIDVDARGTPWIVNDRGEVLRRRSNGEWDLLPGSGTAVTIASNGTAWLLGTDRVPGGFSIHRWTGRAWQPVPGGAVALSAGQVPWLVDSEGNVFRWDARR